MKLDSWPSAWFASAAPLPCSCEIQATKNEVEEAVQASGYQLHCAQLLSPFSSHSHMQLALHIRGHGGPTALRQFT